MASSGLPPQTPPPSAHARQLAGASLEESPPTRFPLPQRGDSFSIPPMHMDREEPSPMPRNEANRLLESENTSLRRRVRELEAENERLKASLVSLSERMSKAMVSKDRSANLERSLLPSPTLLLRTPSESLDAPDGADLPRHDDSLHDEYFSSKAVLNGHEAAVYAVQFSPSGRSLASTSLDKTVRAWSSNGSSDNVVLGRHDMAGTDVRWLKDDLIASSSLDQTVCFWSFPKGDCLSTFKLDSHALCLTSGTSEHVVFAGVSSGAVFALDSRSPAPNVAWRGDSSANALAYHAERRELFVGDGKGQMTILDARQFGVIAQVAVSETSDSKPISGITCSASLIACNSYDAVLRVFDVESRTLLHSLRGHHNRNWPIRSVLISSGSSDYIASGSASHSCYLYGPLRSKEVSPSLIQKLRGHGGNVYATDYCKDTLVSCSADATIRLWRKSFTS